MKKLFWGLGFAFVLVTVLLLPFPGRIVKEYKGLFYANNGDSEPIYSCVLIDGWLYKYLVKPDVYRGKFEISTDDRTVLNNARLNTFVEEKRISNLTYLTDQGYITLGYFVMPKSKEWLYIRTKDIDGNVGEIMAPAMDDIDATRIRQRAGQMQSPLPEI